MASNSYSSMLSLLQMWLKNQEAAEKRQHDMEMLQRQQQPLQPQQSQQLQEGQQQQQQNPMDMYNKYTQISDMLAATPASAGTTPAGSGAGGLFGTPATFSQPAGSGLYGTTSTLSTPAGEGLYGTAIGSTATGTGAGTGAGAGAGAGTGAGGMVAGAAPYAALAAALGAFKLNDDRMSKGAGKTFGGEMQSAWDESFGNHGWWGEIKKLWS